MTVKLAKEMTVAEFRAQRPDRTGGRSWVPRSHPEARRVGFLTFASQAEAKRYTGLLALQRAGQVRYVLLQPTFHVAGVKVRADFQVFWTDGRVTYEDAKARGGHPEHRRRFKRNRTMVRNAYGVEIEEVTP